MAFFSCLNCFKKVEEEEITSLDYAHHSLNDVPNDVFVYERTLEEITLDCNNIRDLPRQLFHCEGLRYLSVADNDIHVIPPAVASLTNLYQLNVCKNVLTDIPDTIKQCKQLAILDASVNPLQKIPEGCTQLLSITELYLNDTFLEFLPANFGRLSRLKILELRENGLNTLPKSLNRLTCLERLDIGQNEMSEVPEIVGSLTNLKELWMDGNRIKSIPNLIGNLRQLSHLDVSLNRIDYISDAIQHCKLLADLSLSTNDLKSLPEAIGGMESLVTLKMDDNQVHELPLSIGRLKNLEELVLSQNYLEHLPPSIGLCRKLHTLNVDDNDIEVLPKEIGSCRSLRILSAHGNRLTTLPAEIDHITNLAVINLTANMIQNLPVSLMKLANIQAIWLSENQHKPLVQLVQDTDPETGQRVLTNFLLPQQNQDAEANLDNKSESGSFHALAWEEERSRRSQVKWAGDYNQPSVETSLPTQSSLRREPTPFPKEMRAMARRVQNLRNKKISEVPADDLQQKKKRRASVDSSTEAPTSLDNQELSVSDLPSVEIKEAKKVLNMPTPDGNEEKELQQFLELEKIASSETSPPPSTDKTSRDSGVSDGSSPDQEPLPTHTNGRNPSDPLPQAPVKAEITTNELDNDELNRKPPPYHIAAQMSKHPNRHGFQGLERKSSFMSDATMESISGSETSTAPSSLQTIVRAPIQNQPPPASTVEASNSSETESVYNHANNLRKVSEKMLLSNVNNSRNRGSLTGIPRLNKSLTANIAGTEMRPSSYAGPHHTIGLPVMSPSARLNTTLPTASATSTLERPRNVDKKSPPPAIPVLNLRPKNNGLLSTIEQAAMSDEEPGSPVSVKEMPPQLPPAIVSSPNNGSRIPTPSMIQPNYENLAGGRLSTDSPVGLTMIPVPKKSSLPSDRLSTANFVANSPQPRKMSAEVMSSSRSFATPSPRPALNSKIPVLGAHSK